ncbi:MAG: metallophosphoesterase family protein [Brevinematia bacterium]|jgi:Icc-related predicted phosphoesterase
MKILCVSDVVDKYLYESQNSLEIKPDLIISCGDLPKHYLEFLISKFNVPLFFVHGNHDNYDDIEFETQKDPLKMIGNSKFNFYSNYDYKKHFAGIDLDRKLIEFQGLYFIGFEGSNKYNSSKHQYSEEEMKRRVRKTYWKIYLNKLINKKYVDILITHSPPLGIHDREDIPHRGFKIFLEFIERFKPKYLLHGHVHRHDLREKRIDEYKGTKIINCYGYYIIEI